MSTAVPVEIGMTSYPMVGAPKMTCHQAMKLMRIYRIRHLPIVEEDRIVGVVSERDLLRVAETKPIDQVMIRNPYIVQSDARFSEVTATMATEKYGSAIVVNQEGRITGIFTTTDALKMLTWYIQKEEKEFASLNERCIEEWFSWDASMCE